MHRRSPDVIRRALALLVVVVAACSSGSSRRLPPPSSTSSTEPDATSTSIDYSRVPLTTVPGSTTTTLAATGDVVLTGTVTGPDGPVPGAHVRIDRLVDDGVQAAEVLADEAGLWRLEGVPGGRYRIRAFLAPTLTVTEPQVVYLRDGETRDIAIALSAWVGQTIVWATTPAEPIVGDGVNLGIQVVERVVDDDGFGQTRPLANIPVRVQSSGWTELEEPLDRTDDEGNVVFEYRCDRVTGVTATAIVGLDRAQYPLPVPPCAPVPTTTTGAPADGEPPSGTG